MASSHAPAADQNQEGRVGKSLRCSSETNLDRADREYIPTRREAEVDDDMNEASSPPMMASDLRLFGGLGSRQKMLQKVTPSPAD